MIAMPTKTSPALNLTDESFVHHNPGDAHLSLLVGENHFSCCVLDIKTKKYFALLSFSQPVSSVLDAETDFSALLPKEKDTYRSVSCAVAHRRSALVPSALFEENKPETFLQLNEPISDREDVFFNTLCNLDAKNVFTVPKDLVIVIRKHFSNAHFIHSSTVFIEGLLFRSKNLSNKESSAKVFADFYPSFFELVVLGNGKLLLNNTFRYETPEDIAYYILFVYEQLHLNPEETELTLSGEIDKTAKEHALLYTYIRHIRFAALPDEFKYSAKFDEAPKHKFFSLMMQYLTL